MSKTIKVLVVGSGGGGGGLSTDIGGGGGAGQLSYNASYTITPQSYSVTVGAGGAQGVSGNSSIFGSITSLGGSHGNPLAGSGGASGSSKIGGAGNGSNAAGGGGGDTGNGVSYSGNNGGAGGTGTANSISGSSVTYSIGGGGGGQSSGPGSTGSTPGCGGGGADSFYPQAGAAGLGGVVIISFATGSITVTVTGGTKTTSGGNDIWTFTSNGTFFYQSPFPPLTATYGSFILTGYAASLVSKFFAAVGLFILTGYSTILNYRKGWKNQTKDSDSWTNQPKS